MPDFLRRPRNLVIGAVALVVVLAGLAVAAVWPRPLEVVKPREEFAATATAQYFQSRGYSLFYFHQKGKQKGFAFVDCHGMSTEECSTNRHQLATAQRPIVYTDLDGRLLMLEGPLKDDRNYYVIIPSHLANFERLPGEYQTALTEQLMSEVISGYRPDSSFVRTARFDSLAVILSRPF